MSTLLSDPTVRYCVAGALALVALLVLAVAFKPRRKTAAEPDLDADPESLAGAAAEAATDDKAEAADSTGLTLAALGYPEPVAASSALADGAAAEEPTGSHLVTGTKDATAPSDERPDESGTDLSTPRHRAAVADAEEPRAAGRWVYRPAGAVPSALPQAGPEPARTQAYGAEEPADAPGEVATVPDPAPLPAELPVPAEDTVLDEQPLPEVELAPAGAPSPDVDSETESLPAPTETEDAGVERGGFLRRRLAQRTQTSADHARSRQQAAERRAQLAAEADAEESRLAAEAGALRASAAQLPAPGDGEEPAPAPVDVVVTAPTAPAGADLPEPLPPQLKA